MSPETCVAARRIAPILLLAAAACGPGAPRAPSPEARQTAASAVAAACGAAALDARPGFRARLEAGDPSAAEALLDAELRSALTAGETQQVLALASCLATVTRGDRWTTTASELARAAVTASDAVADAESRRQATATELSSLPAATRADFEVLEAFMVSEQQPGTYEIALPEYGPFGRQASSRHAVLRTTLTKFQSKGWFTLKVVRAGTQAVKLTQEQGGFTQEWTIFEEVTDDDVADVERQAARRRELQAALQRQESELAAAHRGMDRALSDMRAHAVLPRAASPSSTATTILPGPAPRTTATPTDGPTEAWLAWTVAFDGGIATSWIESASGGHLVVTSRPLLVLARAGDLLIGREGTDSFPSADCNCEMEQMGSDDPKPCPRLPDGSSAEWLTLQSASGRESMEIVPRTTATAAAEASGVGDFQSSVVPTGLAGSLLGVRVLTSSYGCGAAHGGLSSTFFTYDLETRRRVDFPPALSSADAARVKTEALRALQARETFDTEAEELDVTLWQPRFPASAPLELLLQVTGDACYACSDGNWDSYSVSTFVPWPGALPAEVAASARTPPAVASFGASLPEEKRLGGWTRVATADASALRTAFESIQP